MLNGQDGAANALERAQAWRREGLSLRRELMAELTRETAERDAHEKRIEEIRQALKGLPEDDGASPTAEPASPTPPALKRTAPPELSAAMVTRLVMLEVGNRSPASKIIAMSEQISSFKPKRIYNALHRLTTMEELTAVGPHGNKLYSLTAKGREEAEKVSALVGADHVAA